MRRVISVVLLISGVYLTAYAAAEPNGRVIAAFGGGIVLAWWADLNGAARRGSGGATDA